MNYEDPQQIEIEEDVWSKFGEGWRRKGDEEVGEKWRRSGAAADDGPVIGNVWTGRQMNRQQDKGKKKREERKRECDGG